mmetsp:Transcript_26270/g.81796  ORF Transcript_26270/g.81796 Transcript_26270/m.81796 type:complete len:220 (+) Transcript_26270:148-807(+)
MREIALRVSTYGGARRVEGTTRGGEQFDSAGPRGKWCARRRGPGTSAVRTARSLRGCLHESLCATCGAGGASSCRESTSRPLPWRRPPGKRWCPRLQRWRGPRCRGLCENQRPYGTGPIRISVSHWSWRSKRSTEPVGTPASIARPRAPDAGSAAMPAAPREPAPMEWPPTTQVRTSGSLAASARNALAPPNSTGDRNAGRARMTVARASSATRFKRGA